MYINVLGSAAGGGVPQWNCGCANCTAARRGKIPRRTVSAIALSPTGSRWVVVNASCDIAMQFARTPQLAPIAARTSPLAAVLLTDANVDHTAGLLEFRQADSLTIWSSELVKRTLCASPMFAQLDARFFWQTFSVKTGARPVKLVDIDGLAVFASAVDGCLPSYAGGERAVGAAVAYKFEHNGVRVVYAPIFLQLEDALMNELARAEAAFLDGTCWTDDEMIVLGLSKRTAREMGHAPMSGRGGSLERVRELASVRRFYTHVNNSNQILDPASAPARELAHTGCAVAGDGLEIVLNGGH